MATASALNVKQNGQPGANRKPRDASPLLEAVRCSQCGARQFDSRLAFAESGIAVAEIIVKCWRCSRLLGFVRGEPDHE